MLTPVNLETAVGRARVGRDAVRWQGATTLRAHAREKEQRHQRAAARPNRVRSAVTLRVKLVVGTKVNIHALLPAEASSQLPFLGSCHLAARYSQIGLARMLQARQQSGPSASNLLRQRQHRPPRKAIGLLR